MSVEPPRYPYLAVDVAPELADEASAILFELGASGVELRDDTTLVKGAGDGRVTLAASFATEAGARAAEREVDPAWSPRIEEVVGDAWRDAWKAHFQPFALTSRITIRPPWEPYAPTRADERVIELEPGRAFGTGLHATTALVARMLDDRAPLLSGRRVLDVGTGSGILGLLALALGASGVFGIDIDPDAVAVARENATRNHAGGRFSAESVAIEQVQGHYFVVLANIETRVLVPLAAAIGARVESGGLLVLSGLLTGEEDEVARAYTLFDVEERRTEGEWAALALRRGTR